MSKERKSPGLLTLTFCIFVLGLFVLPPSPVLGEQKSFVLTPDLTLGADGGDENLLFSGIYAVGLDRDQNIYILDWWFTSPPRIQVFDSRGGFLQSIPLRQGQGPGEATSVGELAVSPSGTIYVLDWGQNKIMLYDAKGAFLRQFKPEVQPSDFALLPGEQVILLGASREKLLHVCDKDGRVLASYGEPFELPAKLSQYKNMPFLCCPNRFNVGPDGRVYVLDPHRFEISIYRQGKLEGKVEGRSDAFSPMEVVTGGGGMGVGYPRVTALPSGDRLYVGVVRMASAKKGPNELIIYEKGERVGAVTLEGWLKAIDAQGRLYFSEESDFPKMVRYVVRER